MTEQETRTWFETFFEGLATDVWRLAVPEEQTQAEVEFLMAELDLHRGMKVLDVPCADGRLCVPLAKHGISITGVDLSQRCLSAAQDDAESAGLTQAIKYLREDMRKLGFKNEFDGAFCMGNSFSYFNEKDTVRFLEGVAAALKPGAGFVLDTCLAAETLFTVGGQKEWAHAEGIYMLMENNYDCRTGCLQSRFTFISGDTREEHDTTHWIFTAKQICDFCENAGLRVVELLGSLEGEPFELGSERLLVCCKRELDTA